MSKFGQGVCDVFFVLLILPWAIVMTIFNELLPYKDYYEDFYD